EVDTDVYLAEVQSEIDVMDAAQIESVEREAGRQLSDATERLVRKAQSEFKSDILGLGRRVYQRDVRLWKQLESNWTSIFPTVSVEVSCRVNIKNSAFIKSEEALRS
ncbi:MAG: Ger(x)C family spore germination C-terminal domain-containing protein, partial [Eubacteriales bacterium]|nr:Ger(x)C family spore germination C-terminal domain-containing protein [Eubacteriales bacterium]